MATDNQTPTPQVDREQIQREYMAITDFGNGALLKLAKKHGLSLDELLNIIKL